MHVWPRPKGVYVKKGMMRGTYSCYKCFNQTRSSEQEIDLYVISGFDGCVWKGAHDLIKNSMEQIGIPEQLRKII
jgi:hypothetical protein